MKYLLYLVAHMFYNTNTVAHMLYNPNTVAHMFYNPNTVAHMLFNPNNVAGMFYNLRSRIRRQRTILFPLSLILIICNTVDAR